MVSITNGTKAHRLFPIRHALQHCSGYCFFDIFHTPTTHGNALASLPDLIISVSSFAHQFQFASIHHPLQNSIRFRSLNIAYLHAEALRTIDTDLQSLYNESSSSTHGRRRIRASDRGPALFFSAIVFILFIKTSLEPGQHHRISRHQLIHINIAVFITNPKNDNVINRIFREPD